MKAWTLLCIVACPVIAGCSTVLDRHRHADPRTDRPAPMIFEKGSRLPGRSDVGPAEAEGVWSFFRTEQRVPLDEGEVAPFLYYALHLKLGPGDRYELVYQAYVNTRNLGDPRMRALDVRETGRFSLAAGTLQLEPNGTTLAEKHLGRITTQAIPDEHRRYEAALDGAWLNIAGPCARYQVEPICRDGRDLWYSLRASRLDWPLPPLR